MSKRSSSSVAIGIDLGTTYSCVAVYRNDKVEIIPNEFGERTTPSYVSFTDTERLLGTQAKLNSDVNAANTVFDIKRLIGRKLNDPILAADMPLWPFTVVPASADDNTPAVMVTYKGQVRTFSAEQISAQILSKMRSIAEAHIGDTITDAVITVPAYFNDSQRAATKDAGQIAGLNVLRIINEPTAAAIAYGLERSTEERTAAGEKNILIFDLGGGTFDVSLLSIDKGVYEVKATSGDTHLGGEDFDAAIINHVLTQWDKQFAGQRNSIRTDERALRRLRSACENAKCALSHHTETLIQLSELNDGHSLSLILSRDTLIALCKPLFDSTLTPVESVLREAKIDKSQVDQVVLVGGSTRIPYVQNILSQYFNGKTLCKSIDPDCAVAYGAAVQAAILSGRVNEKTKDLLLIDVTPLSVGVETVGGLMNTLIKRNSTIPCKRTAIFSNNTDNQMAVDISVYEGERARTADNALLGTFELSPLTPLPKGRLQIAVTFDLDANGILSVSATETSSGVQQRICISADRGRLSSEDIAAMIAEAEQFAIEDECVSERLKAKQALDALCTWWNQSASTSGVSASSIHNEVTSALHWLQCDGDAASIEEIEAVQAKIEAAMAPYIKQNGMQRDMTHQRAIAK